MAREPVPEDQGRKNAEAARERWRKHDEQKAAGTLPTRVVTNKAGAFRQIVIPQVHRRTYGQLEKLARQSNLTVAQLALHGLDLLLTSGPNGGPVVLPKWSKPLDR